MRVFNAYLAYGFQSDPADDPFARALCRGEDPERWFPVGKGALAERKAARAVAICRRCPAIDACRKLAARIQPAYGVWAGTTEEHRRWCQWCEQPFEADTTFARSRICEPCANRERFGEPVLHHHGPGATQAAKTHCPANHAYDELNTYTDRHGHRHCRKCRNRIKADADARAKALQLTGKETST